MGNKELAKDVQLKTIGTQPTVRKFLKISQNLIDKTMIGPDIKLEDDSISGVGRVYGIEPVEQNKLYYEVHVIEPGEIRAGVAIKSEEDVSVPLGDAKSWGSEFGASTTPLKEGDVIGVSFDQSNFARISYLLNGKPLENIIEGIKGSVVIAISLQKGAKVKLAINQEDFSQPIPPGFMHFVKEISLLDQ